MYCKTTIVFGLFPFAKCSILNKLLSTAYATVIVKVDIKIKHVVLGIRSLDSGKIITICDVNM